jgi:hypothetical protein
MRRLLQELAGVENAVVRLKVSVSIDLPSNFHSGAIADKASPAAVGRDQQERRHCIDSIVEALPPLGDKIRRRDTPRTGSV